MRIASFRLSAAFLLVCVALPSQSAPPPVVEKSDGAILIVGEISPGVHARFQQLLDDSVKTVRIRSGGGDDLSAIAIGREIRRRDLRVEVLQACMAACANYVFLAARNRTINPHSLVAFQHTASSLIAMVGSDRSKPILSLISNRAAAAENFYRGMGLDRRFLLQPQLEIRTSCYYYLDSNESGNSGDLRYKAANQAWIPSRQLMTSAGVEFSGFWPASSQELQATAVGIFSQNSGMVLLYGGPDSLMTETALDARLRRIAKC